MLQFFGAGGGIQKFDKAPTAGKPSIAIGNGTFGGGAAPDFQGTAALGVNMAAGYASNLLDLQIAGVSVFRVSNSNMFANDITAVNSGLFSSFLQVVSTRVGFQTAFIRATALQTADPFQIQDSTPINQFGIANTGTGVAPVWGLRVAPVANAESMAQAHVIGAATGKAIQVVDNAGTTIGWISLNA